MQRTVRFSATHLLVVLLFGMAAAPASAHMLASLSSIELPIIYSIKAAPSYRSAVSWSCA